MTFKNVATFEAKKTSIFTKTSKKFPSHHNHRGNLSGIFQAADLTEGNCRAHPKNVTRTPTCATTYPKSLYKAPTCTPKR